MSLRKLFFVLFILFFSTNSHAQSWRNTFTAALKNGGAIAVDDSGKVLYEHRSQDHFIPASIIKLATTACALHEFGRDFRFKTDLYLTDDHKLVLKGYGDPFLVSEELAKMAAELKNKGLSHISGIIVDTSYFADNLVLDGVSNSTNPYDALNGAMIVNFNTINVQKLKNGEVISAESQTPLTATARDLARNVGAGKQRINLGKDASKGAIYAGELLAAFLQKEGVSVDGGITLGKVTPEMNLFYQHTSSKPLTELISGLLEYSTNFMANQLFLTMGAKVYGAPATQEKGLKVLKDFLSTQVGWHDFELAEGSGLSRQNQVTPEQMLQLLNYFTKDKDLMPTKEGLFKAKTGTLTGVNSFAGYFMTPSGKNIKFVIMVNSPVPFDYKFRLGKMLYEGLKN